MRWRFILVGPGLLLLLWPVASGSAQTVDDVVAANAGGCTTAGAEMLNDQLVASHLCAYPTQVSEFTPYPNITLTSSRVHPLAASSAVAAIRAAADVSPLEVSSAFRTLVEQYLLFEEGGCGLAATPGNSNHQTGRAVDLRNFSAARSAMIGAGCAQSFPVADPVHFDCPGPDMRQASVEVFQRLWNVNNPADLIDEDGLYGPITGARVGRSPVGGFTDDLCTTAPGPEFGARFVMQTFLRIIVLAPGEERLGTIELENIGTTAWDASTHLGTTGPRDSVSPLAGPDWVSPSRPDAVEGTVAMGDTFPFTFTVRAPASPGEYTQTFGVVQEGVAWFSDPGHLGPPDDVIQIRVRVQTAPTSDAGVVTTDGGMPRADGGEGRDFEGGCACRAVLNTRSANRRGAAIGLGLLLIVFARRRRSSCSPRRAARS